MNNKSFDKARLFLAAVLILGALLNIVLIKNLPTPGMELVGVDPSEIPADAVTETGTGKGIDGNVVVQVTADANRIYSIQILEQNETVGIGSVAIEKLPSAIIEANSLLADSISGATVTSTAIKDGIREALTKMGFDPANYENAVETVARERTPVTVYTDVVVVGAGGAGLTASVLATQQGMDVILLEKMPFVGGNSLRAEGGMNAAGTRLEAELGLTDSTVENFTEDTLRLGHYLANPDLVRTLAENSSDAIEWLKTVNAEFTGVKATGGCEGRKYLHQPEGGAAVGEYLVEKLKTQAEKLGIDVRVNTTATEILTDNGQAVGVLAHDSEHDYTIYASSVVITTGGFGANFELMSSYDPSLANAVTTNHSGAQGDGIMMAQAVGADTVDMEQIQLHPTVIQSDGTLVSESFRSLGAIVVNTEGKRFVNDLAGRDVVSQAELKQPDGYCFIIFDQNLVDHLALSQKFIDRGFTIQGETYEELAQNMGLTGDAVQNFVNTMNTWNASVAKGIDEEFGRNNGMDDDLSTAPFYAIKIAPGIHHTMGGIRIDTKAQVLDTNGNPIPGLFAAGETTGGIHGGNRVGGNAVCDFIVFGRIAGQSATDYAKSAVPEDAVKLTGVGKGRNGDIKVELTATADKLYGIKVLEHQESEGIGTAAFELLPGKILSNNSLKVDAVSGATLSSEGFLAAIEDALKSGGLDPGAFMKEVAAAAPVEKTPVELDCDVVVVGAGGAGLTASVLATQQGMDVILLEKMPFVGGNSLRAEGGMNAAGTALEAELGLTDSTVENFTEDTLRLGHYLADPALVQTLAEKSSDAIEWLKTVNAQFTGVKATGGCEGRKYLHQPEGGVAVGEYLVDKLKTQAEKLGIDVRVNTKATEILMDNGSAVGVVAEDAEHIYTINAKSVVITTGGFGANFELMASYDPSLANAVTTNHSGAQGDGIMMAQAVGADTVDMEQIQLHPTVIQSDGTLVSESFRSLGAIVVNTEGKRFVNDLAGRDVVSQAELKQPDGYCFIIFDQNLVDHLALSQKFIDRGFTIQGETYEELAQNMGLTGDAVQNFVNTMNTWNASVANGIDEEFGRNNGMDDDLSVAPFYAIKIAPGIHHTMGGIKINTNAEVIGTDGNVIPGLFAAGETTGGIHGGNRVGGNAVCDFIVFGRIAAQSATDYAGAEALPNAA